MYTELSATASTELVKRVEHMIGDVENAKFIFRFVLPRVRNIDDAADLAQQVLLQAWEKRQGLRDGARFKTWLCAIAINLTNTWFKKEAKHRHAQFEESAGFPDPKSRDPGKDLETEELDRFIRQQILGLPPRDCELLLRWWQEEEECPCGLKISKCGPCRSALHRARQRFISRASEIVLF